MDTWLSGNATTMENGRIPCSRLTLARQSTASPGLPGSTGLSSPQEQQKAKSASTHQLNRQTKQPAGRRSMNSLHTMKVSTESAGDHPRSQQSSPEDRDKTANRLLAANSSHLPSDWSPEETIAKLTSGSSMMVPNQH